MKMSKVNFSAMPYLETLDLEGTELKEIDLSYNRRLKGYTNCLGKPGCFSQ